MMKDFYRRLGETSVHNFKTRISSALHFQYRNKNFWKNAGLLLLANVIVTILALIRTPLITWIIPKEEYGMLGVVSAWIPFLQLISFSGMDGAAYHYVAKGRSWAFVTNLFYRLRWSILSSVVLLVIALYWMYQNQIGLAALFFIAGITYPFTVGMTASAGMLAAQERFKGLFWYRILESLTDFIGFIPLIFSIIIISKVNTFYAGNQLATLIMQAGLSFWLAYQVKNSGAKTLNDKERHEFIHYGQHLTAISAIAVLGTRFDALLVGSFFPVTVMADYTIALLIFEQCKRLWVIYSSTRYPFFVNLPVFIRKRKIIIEGLLVWLLFIGGAVLLAIASQILIPLLLPKNYSTSLPYIRWFLGVFAISVPGFMAEIFLRTHQDQKGQYLMRTVAAVAGVLLPLLLVSSFGVPGVLFGRFVAAALLSIAGVLLILSRKIEAVDD